MTTNSMGQITLKLCRLKQRILDKEVQKTRRLPDPKSMRCKGLGDRLCNN